MTGDGVNKDDIATSQVGDVWLPLCGAFTGTPAAGLKETVLLKSTKDSQLVEGIMAAMGGQNILNDFKPSGTEYALAVRLTGKFKTAFPDGKPKEAKPDEKPSTNTVAGLKETTGDNSVVLFGDSDFIYDQFALEKQNVFGMSMVRVPLNVKFEPGTERHLNRWRGDNNLMAYLQPGDPEPSAGQTSTKCRRRQDEAEQGKKKEFDEKRSARRAGKDVRANCSRRRIKDSSSLSFVSPEQQAELREIGRALRRTSMPKSNSKTRN